MFTEFGCGRSAAFTRVNAGGRTVTRCSKIQQWDECRAGPEQRVCVRWAPGGPANARWDDYRPTQTAVTTPTPDTGLVTYRARARRGEAYTALMRALRRAGGWRPAFHRQTPA